MSYARTNNSTHATIDRSSIFASGAFKNVWQGTYTGGSRTGQSCVAKEFKTGSVFEEDYFQEEMNIIRRTQKTLNDWNEAHIINRYIYLNTPAIWTYVESKHKHLIEPMIENFEKFNSNTGWVSANGQAWGEVMQALSHFSYHKSGGQLLLCDLQGGVYSDGFVLSDPVIMSQTNSYGPADLGPDGIRSFFQRHRCGDYCSREWTKPAVIGKAVFPMRQGTSMVQVPTQASRNPLSRLRE